MSSQEQDTGLHEAAAGGVNLSPDAEGQGEQPSRLGAVSLRGLMDLFRQARAPDMLRQVGLYGVLAALLVFFASTAPYFFTAGNFRNVLVQVSIVGMLAVGETFVIIAAGIDLSVGSVVGLAGVAAAFVALRPTGAVVPVLAGVAVGGVVGLVNGAFISIARIPAFIVTLASLSAVRGVAFIVTNTETVFGFNKSFQQVGSGSFAGLPVSVVMFFTLMVCGFVTLRYTPFGRHVFAIGGNRGAAELFGVAVRRTELVIYTLSGAIAGLAGAALAARIAAGEPGIAQGYELTAIAAVIIGGTSLFGGEGGVERTLVGILILGVIANGMNLLGIASYYQLVLTGVVVVGAVLLDRVAKQRAVS